MQPVCSLVSDNDQTGLCLDVKGADVSSGTGQVGAFTCNLTVAQKWNFEGSTIEGLGTTSQGPFCLDVFDNGVFDGTPVDITRCNGTTAQTWFYDNQGAIVGERSRKCLTVPFDTPLPHPVVIQTCGFPFRENNQIWTIR
jgi:hypothetical protein